MLWAGDCVHGGVADVARLQNYDVFLCQGFPEGLAANLDALRTDQFICILDVHDEQQIAAFRDVFRGRFRHINSDYNGNTPSLPLHEYRELLERGGTARNVFGIHGTVMPYEDYYCILEIFAPVLPGAWKDRRRWSSEIITLSERDHISPAMVWTDDELNYPHYRYAKEAQIQFETDRKRMNPAWPTLPPLAEHWETLPLNTLHVPQCIHLPSGPMLMKEIEPYLPSFSAHLSERIKMLPQFSILDMAELEERCALLKPLEAICEKMQCIKMLSTPIPGGLIGSIRYFPDDRLGRQVLDLALTCCASMLEHLPLPC
jgi:hypothetical protein